MSDTSLRARSVSEIVDAAFALYRRHALQYIAVSAIATAPGLIINLILISGPLQDPAEFWRYLPGYGLMALSYYLSSAVISRMGSDVYLGHEPDLPVTVRDVVRKFPTLFGVSVLTSLLIGIGAVLLLAPGVYAFIALFAVAPVVVLENKGMFGAMARSARLTKGRKGHVFGTIALVFVIYFIFSFGFTLAALSVGSVRLQMISSALVSIFGYPLINLVTMVLYYDLRIRAEGFDLEHMASTIGGSATASTMGATPA